MKNCVHVSVSNNVKVFLKSATFPERKQLVRLDSEFYYNPHLESFSWPDSDAELKPTSVSTVRVLWGCRFRDEDYVGLVSILNFSKKEHIVKHSVPKQSMNGCFKSAVRERFEFPLCSLSIEEGESWCMESHEGHYSCLETCFCGLINHVTHQLQPKKNIFLYFHVSWCFLFVLLPFLHRLHIQLMKTNTSFSKQTLKTKHVPNKDLYELLPLQWSGFTLRTN